MQDGHWLSYGDCAMAPSTSLLEDVCRLGLPTVVHVGPSWLSFACMRCGAYVGTLLILKASICIRPQASAAET